MVKLDSLKNIVGFNKIGFENISFPTLIRLPDWVENKLGNFYLYYAHHKGQSFKLAYTDSLYGPSTSYN